MRIKWWLRRFPADMDVSTKCTRATWSPGEGVRQTFEATLHHKGVPMLRAAGPSPRVAVKRLVKEWRRKGRPNLTKLG